MDSDEYISRREFVSEELAWAKRHLSLEDYLAKGFWLLGVKPYITHLKQLEWCRYSVVTIATSQYATYRNLDIALSKIYLEGSILHKTGSALDALIVKRFAEFNCGVAPCHAADNFSRKRGRILSEGRLLKLLRKGMVRQSIQGGSDE